MDTNDFYISKAMLSLTKGKIKNEIKNEINKGINIEKFFNKIDFIRSVEITSNTTKKEIELLKNSELIGTKIYRAYAYNNLFTTSNNGHNVYLFYKYGEGGLCSILVVCTRKEKEKTSDEIKLKWARVLLIGGTFKAEDIPTLINLN